MIKFLCSHCGQRISADESVLGTEVTCPACSQPFAANGPQNAADAAAGETATPPPLPQPPPEGRVRRISGLGCLGILSVLAIVAIIDSLLSKPSQSAQNGSAPVASNSEITDTASPVSEDDAIPAPRVNVDPVIKAKAEAGDVEAQYEVGSQLLDMKNYNKGEVMKWWLRAADNGYWKAQLRVGNEYLDNKDNERGKRYTKLAAEQGSIDAMNNLGYVERGSTGQPPNYIESLKWYRIGEIVSLQRSVNIEYVKKQIGTAEIQHAEIEANRWIENHPNITKK